MCVCVCVKISVTTEIHICICYMKTAVSYIFKPALFASLSIFISHCIYLKVFPKFKISGVVVNMQFRSNIFVIYSKAQQVLMLFK